MSFAGALLVGGAGLSGITGAYAGFLAPPLLVTGADAGAGVTGALTGGFTGAFTSGLAGGGYCS